MRSSALSFVSFPVNAIKSTNLIQLTLNLSEEKNHRKKGQGNKVTKKKVIREESHRNKYHKEKCHKKKVSGKKATLK